MKKHTHELQYSFLVYLILLLIITWASYSIFSEKREPDPVKVSVIVEDSSNARWTTFKLGLETSARDHRVDLNYITTTEFEDMKEQWSLVEKMKDSAGGIILSPISYEGMDEYYEPLSWEMSLVFVESDVKRGDQTDENIILVAPDYEKIAESIFVQIENDYGKSLEGKEVLIGVLNENQLSDMVLISSLQEKLEASGCIFLGYKNYKKSSEVINSKKADILIGLDDSSLLFFAKEVSDDKNNGIYGIGVSESCIYYLDKGLINGMIVVDDFNMGYESVARIAENIRNKYTRTDSVELNYYAIRSEDVHDQMIENLLFPVVQ